MTNEILIKTKGRAGELLPTAEITVTISRYSPRYLAKRDNPLRSTYKAKLTLYLVDMGDIYLLPLSLQRLFPG